MSRQKKNALLILIYTIMILLCFFMVVLVDELCSPGPGTENTKEQSSEEYTKEEQPETGEDTESPKEETEIQETSEAFKDQKRHGEKKSEVPTPEEETVTEEEYRPPVVVIASDIHYFSPELTDYGEAFDTMMERDDGKVTNYIPQLMDGFIAEMTELQPSAVVLTGDLTLNGEKAGHEALAGKLRILESKGVNVLVIPGNHDMNNYFSASYFGDEKKVAPIAGPEEFYEIYREFGYDQALSRDEASLSYVYELDEKNWLLLLDSAEYEPLNKVGGRIKEETLEWMEIQLEQAKERGIQVVPAAHHNLLKESILYPEDCTLENSREVTRLLESYRLPLYISGHLHLQRVKKYKPEPGESDETYHISEIVADSFAIPPCQYGVLKWSDDGRLFYTTKKTDMEKWAADQNVTDENLLGFDEYGEQFLTQIISAQVHEKIKNMPDDHTEKMARLYGDLNRAYCAGLPIDSETIRTEEAFRLWQRNLPESKMFEEIDEILRDTGRNHNSWSGAWEENSQ